MLSWLFSYNFLKYPVDSNTLDTDEEILSPKSPRDVLASSNAVFALSKILPAGERGGEKWRREERGRMGRNRQWSWRRRRGMREEAQVGKTTCTVRTVEGDRGCDW
jgi:hypothetical protein